MPVGSADLTFDYPNLVTESEDLSAAPGVWPVPDDQGLQQESDDGVGDGEEHDGEDRRGPPDNAHGPALSAQRS